MDGWFEITSSGCVCLSFCLTFCRQLEEVILIYVERLGKQILTCYLDG